MFQLIPITEATASLPDHNGSIATNELVFQAILPPLGFSSYFIKEDSTGWTILPPLEFSS